MSKPGTWAVYRLTYFGRELEHQGSHAACLRVAELLEKYDRDAEIEKVSDEAPAPDGYVIHIANALDADGDTL